MGIDRERRPGEPDRRTSRTARTRRASATPAPTSRGCATRSRRRPRPRSRATTTTRPAHHHHRAATDDDPRRAEPDADHRHPAVNTALGRLRRNAELGLICWPSSSPAAPTRSPASARPPRCPATSARSSRIVFGLLIVAHLAVRRLAPEADGILLPLAALLNGIGYVFIARLKPSLAGLQASWTAVGILAFVLTLLFVRRVRDLERYRYTFMFIGLGLLLLPLVPGLGRGDQRLAHLGPRRARSASSPASSPRSRSPCSSPPTWWRSASCSAWPRGRQWRPVLPDPKHLGPVLIAWAVAILVMTAQKDLGSSLLFFALFVVMLWVATARAGYLVVGAGLFGVAAYGAYHAFAHVQERVSTWIDPWTHFDKGYQVIQSWYALAWGGLAGTGLGARQPRAHPGRRQRLHLRGHRRGARPVRRRGGPHGLPAVRRARASRSPSRPSRRSRSCWPPASPRSSASRASSSSPASPGCSRSPA